MTIYKWIIINLLCVATISCSYSIDILICGNNPFKPTFTLTKPFLSNPVGSVMVELREFYIYEYSNSDFDYRHPIWGIVAVSNEGTRINSIIFGETPAGFTEYSGNKSLEIGKHYYALATSWGGVGGEIFTISNKGGTLNIVTANRKKQQAGRDRHRSDKSNDVISTRCH